MRNAIARLLTRIAAALRGEPPKAKPLPGELAPGESFVNVRPPVQSDGGLHFHLSSPRPAPSQAVPAPAEERPALPPKPDGRAVAEAARRYASQAARPEEFVRKLHSKDFDGALMDIRHLYRLLVAWTTAEDKGLYANDPFGLARRVVEKDPWRYLTRPDQVYDNYRENGGTMLDRAKKMVAASRNAKDIADALLWRVHMLGKALRGEDF